MATDETPLGQLTYKWKKILTENDIDDIIDLVYPVGAIYMSVNSVNPSTLFGGTWEKIEDKFLLASGTTFADGSTGGSKDAVVVEHNHTQNSHNHTQNAHSHTMPNSTVVYNANLNRGLVSSATSTKVALNSTLSTPLGTGSQTATNNSATATNNPSGEDGTNKNMPPYLAVNIWKRVA